MKILAASIAALVFSTIGQAADFGPAPTFTSDDPNVTITLATVQANGTVAMKVNGHRYSGKMLFNQTSYTGGIAYYTSIPAYLFTKLGTKSIYTQLMMSYQHLHSCVGGVCTNKNIYTVLGGTVTLQ